MQENVQQQRIPVKVYRSAGRITVAAPMPGLEPEDISVEVTGDNKLVLAGELRGALKGMKDLLLDEWSVGAYRRELDLPSPVNGEDANVTYGNGVLVVALPVAERTRPAKLSLAEIAPDRGAHFGNAGHAMLDQQASAQA